MKIQTKTTILFTLLSVTVFIILGLFVYYFLNQFAYNDFYKRLELRARIAAKTHFDQDHPDAQSIQEIQKQYLERLQDERSYIIPVLQKNKTITGLPITSSSGFFEDIRKANGTTVFLQNDDTHYAGILYKHTSGDSFVIESAVNSYGGEIMKRLRNILITMLVAAIAIVYFAGKYLSRKTFQPFRDINKRVQAISEGNIHMRLEEQEGSDEITELVQTSNKMLDRLETAFEMQNNFISHASHELRTPLTAIIAEADYALKKERDTASYQQSLQHIMRQSEKLQNLTYGLLSLAQTGFNGKELLWEKIGADELIHDVKNNIDAILPDNQITIEIPGYPFQTDSSIFGNRSLLRTALGNIVLNGCKYSHNKEVFIQLFIQHGTATIKVKDNGIGIPAQEIRKIYTPFFRGSNTIGFEGFGIGMPLSNTIFRIHKGTISVLSQVNEGTTVTINLPLG